MGAAPTVTFLSISLEGWLTMAALVIGPVAALFIQKRLDDRRAKIDRKIKIFRDLIANRANRLSPQYVQALNGIETEFYGDKKVIGAWRALLEHLYTPEPSDEVERGQWLDRINERLTDLLCEMAEQLGYRFDRVDLKRYAYYPTRWNTVELENMKLWQAGNRMVEDDKPLNSGLGGQAASANDTAIPVNPSSLPRAG